MTEEKIEKVISLLQGIRDSQALALERQARQIEIAEKMMSRADEQYEKASRLTRKAEALQDKGLKAIKWFVILAVIAVVVMLIAR